MALMDSMSAGFQPGGILSAIFGGGTPGGPNQTYEAERLKNDRDMYNAVMLDADTKLWKDLNAPQIGSTAPVVVGTDPNGAPIFGPSSATVAAPTWKRADVSSADAAQAGAAPQVSAAMMGGTQLDLAQANQARANQNSLVASLQGTAAGQGPSIAQEQLRQSTDANMGRQMAAAQTMHGAARIAALRNAGAAGAQQQQMANSQAAQLRAQEIASAQTNLGGALGMQRGMDINTASQNAQLAQQMGLTNAGFQQQAGLQNAQLGQQTNLLNANLLQGARQFNAGAQNTAGLNFATQANAGDLSIATSNLAAQGATNQLNTDRATSMADIGLRATGGKAAIASELYQGQKDFEAEQRKNNKGILGDMASSVGMGGMFGGGGGGGISLGGIL